MPINQQDNNFQPAFLNGGGEMGAITRSVDWSKNPLGDPGSWPQSLRTTLSIILNSKFPMFLFWGPQHVCFYNDAYRPSLGNNGKHPAVGTLGADLWPEIWDDIKPLIDQVMAGGEATWSEDQLLPIYRNGKIEDVYWTFSYSPVHDESGKPAGVFVTCTETTGKVLSMNKLKEMYTGQKTSNDELKLNNNELITSNEQLSLLRDELAANQARLKGVLQQATAGIMICNGPELIIESVNDAMLVIINRRSNITGMPFREVLPELKEQGLFEVLDHVYASGETFVANEAKVAVNRGGELIDGYYNFSYQAISNDNGETTGILIVATDVTGQVNTRLSSARIDEQLRLAVEGARMGVWHIEPETKALEYNETLANIFGYEGTTPMTYDMAIGQVSEDYREPILKAIKEAIKTGGDYNITYSQRRFNDDKLIWLNSFGKIIADAEGNYTLFSGIVMDVTAQQESQNKIKQLNNEYLAINEELEAANEEITASNEELISSREVTRASEERLRLIADNITQLVWMADAGGSVFWYNSRWYEFTGTTFDEMRGWGWQKVQHPDYADKVTAKLKRHIAAGKKFEDTFPLLGAEGKYHWFLTRVVPGKNSAGEVIYWFGSSTDITEQKESQGQIQQLNNEYASINEELTVMNEELNESRDELLATYESLETLTNNLNQAIEVARIDLWTVDLNTGLLSLSNRSMNTHGLPAKDAINYNQSLTLIDPEYRVRIDKIIKAAISKIGSFTVEYKVLPQNGEKARWMKSTGQVYADHDGKPIRMGGLMMDITEQKEDEQRKNDFIGMVSHELKTPLTSLTAYIQMLQGKARTAGDSFTGGALDKANRQIDKMRAMVNGFLNVSRLESGKMLLVKERFDIEELIEDLVDEQNLVVLNHNINFKPASPIFVYADRDKISSVISNFISNADKYSPNGKGIKISTSIKNGQVIVSVTDEGMGIAKDDLTKLFDRYYRVEGSQMKSISGFGIGLYLCSEIIQGHEGRIWVESELGEGSTFHFSLPVTNT